MSSTSLVDPDGYLVDPGSVLDFDDAVPSDVIRLAVEVTVTTQSHDRGPKLIAYAKAGVPEVWLIDPRPEVGELVRHRDPEGASNRTVDRFDVGENAGHLHVTTMLQR